MGKFRIAILSLGLLAAMVAFAELQRVAAGQRFLVDFPWDQPPTSAELHDARRTAQTSQLWAVAAVLLATFLAISKPEKFRAPSAAPPSGWSSAVLAFTVTAIADLGTTLWFMHIRGIDLEVHPGIRLFAYAYGRTLGPVLAKLLQWGALLWLGRRWQRWGTRAVFMAAVLCGLAALHNFNLMRALAMR